MREGENLLKGVLIFANGVPIAHARVASGTDGAEVGELVRATLGDWHIMAHREVKGSHLIVAERYAAWSPEARTILPEPKGLADAPWNRLSSL